MKYVFLVAFACLLVLSAVAAGLLPAPPRDGKTRLTWVSDPSPARAEQITLFNRTHPRLEQTLDTTDTGEGLQKIIVQSTSGVGPDVFDIYGGAPDLQAFVEAGIAWDLSPLAARDGFAADGRVWPGVRTAITYAGAQYAYPANVSTDLLIYNKNVFDRCHVPYPAEDLTWEEFFALAGRFPHDDADPGSLYAVSGLNWKHFFNSLDGEYFSVDGTRLALGEGPLRAAFQMHHDLLFRARATPRALDLTTLSAQGGWGGGFSHFADGKFAMLVSGKWALTGMRQALLDQENRLRRWEADPARDPARRPELLRLGAVMLPHAAGQPRRYLAVARTVAINARSPRREAALQFLAYLAGPEYSRTVNQNADGLPGNPRYADEGLVETGDPDLSALELHRRSVDAIGYSRAPRLSPFLLTNDVERVLTDQVNRMEVNADLSAEELLKSAGEELAGLLQRNLDQSPALRAEFDRRRAAEGAAAPPVPEVAAANLKP